MVYRSCTTLKRCIQLITVVTEGRRVLFYDLSFTYELG